MTSIEMPTTTQSQDRKLVPTLSGGPSSSFSSSKPSFNINHLKIKKFIGVQ